MPSFAEKAKGAEERPPEIKKARKFEVVDTPKKLEQMRQRALASLTEAAQEAVNERNVRLVSSVEAVGGTEQDKIGGKRRLRLVQNEEEELTSEAQKEIESEGAVPLATYDEQLGEISEIAAKEKLEKQVAEAWEWYLAEPGKIEEKKPEEIIPEKEAAKPEEILAGPDYNRLAAKLGFSDAEKLSEEDAKAFVEAKLKRRRESKQQEAPMAGRGYSGGEILTEDEAEKLEEQFKNKKFESEFKNNLENLQVSRQAFANLDRFKKKKNTPEWQAAQEKYLQNLRRRQNLLLGLKKSELEELKKDSKEEWEKLGFGKDLEFDDLKLSKKELLAKYGKEYPKRIKMLENGIKDMKKLGFSGEFDYDKELLKQSEEIVQATMVEEGIKLNDLKTKLRLEEQGKTKFEKLKDYAFSAVDKYRKLPLRTKLMYSGILLGVGVGAGAVGGATGAAMLTGVVAGRWFQKAFGAGASFLGFEAILKRAQEKEKQKKAREVAKNLESYLSNNDKKLDDKFKELMKNKDIRRYVLAGGAAAALVLLGPWVGGKVHEAVSHYFSGPVGLAEKMPTGIAKGIGAAPKAEHLPGVSKAEHLVEEVKKHGHRILHHKLPTKHEPYPTVQTKIPGTYQGRDIGAPTHFVHSAETPPPSPPSAPPPPGGPPGTPGHPIIAGPTAPLQEQPTGAGTPTQPTELRKTPLAPIKGHEGHIRHPKLNLAQQHAAEIRAKQVLGGQPPSPSSGHAALHAENVPVATPEAAPPKVDMTSGQKRTVKDVYKILRGDESLKTKNKNLNKILGPRGAQNVMRVYGKGEITDKRIGAENKIWRAIKTLKKRR